MIYLQLRKNKNKNTHTQKKHFSEMGSQWSAIDCDLYFYNPRDSVESHVTVQSCCCPESESA